MEVLIIKLIFLFLMCTVVYIGLFMATGTNDYIEYRNKIYKEQLEREKNERL